MLKAGRDARELSLERLARALNLDLSAVEAIESDRYAVIGAPVFVRGHLRKYADLVGVSPAEVMTAYERAEEPAHRVQLHPMKPEEPVRDDMRLWPIVLVLLFLTGAVVWWLLRPSQPETLEPPPVAEESAAPEAKDETETPGTGEGPAEPGALQLPRPSGTVTPGDGQPGDTPGEAAAATGSPPPVEAPPRTPESTTPAADMPVTEPAPDSGTGAAVPIRPVPEPPATVAPGSGLTVQFAFTADSWIDVRDAGGTRLAYELGRSGTTRTVRGEPPLTVFLGYADGVEVRVEGRLWQVPGRVRRGNTARFTLEAP